MAKTCYRCREERPGAFSKDASRKDGLQTYCKACQAGAERAARRAHPDKRKATVAAWAEAHREDRKIYNTAWCKSHLDKRKAVMAAWRATHPERIKAINKAAGIKWRQANPDKASTIKHRRRARNNAALGSHTTAQWLDLVETHGGRCVYCDEAKPLARDHVIPLARGGSNFIYNIVPACRSCNCSKGAKTGLGFFEWLLERAA